MMCRYVDEDCRGAVALQADLLKQGGYLLVTVPNTRYSHKFLMKTFCPDVYEIHRDCRMGRKVPRSHVSPILRLRRIPRA